MNREILFRGKRVDNGEWAEGYYYESRMSGCFILVSKLKARKKDGVIIGDSFDVYEVIPETVGQYTGLTDKNGKKIFEGDIAKYNTIAANERTVYGIIKYRSTYEQYRSHNPCGYIIDWQKNNSTGRTLREDLPFWCDSMSNMEVIGNIHANPELLEVQE